MVVGDARSDCNGSSTFSFLVMINSIKYVILNIELLKWFLGVCLKREPHLCLSLAAVY
jgi:hypothetical protein